MNLTPDRLALCVGLTTCLELVWGTKNVSAKKYKIYFLCPLFEMKKGKWMNENTKPVQIWSSHSLLLFSSVVNSSKVWLIHFLKNWNELLVMYNKQQVSRIFDRVQIDIGDVHTRVVQKLN